MADAHGADIRRYLEDAFGYTGDLVTSTDRLIDLFRELGADMYFDGEVKEEQVRSLPVESQLSMDQRIRMIRACMRDQGGGCAKELIEGKTDVFCGKNMHQ